VTIFPTNRFYQVLIALALLCFTGYFLPVVFDVAQVVVVAFFMLLIGDYFLLFRSGKLELSRPLPDRLSNGDQNTLKFTVKSRYVIPVRVHVIDELPAQFQQRSFLLELRLAGKASMTESYNVVPMERGEYLFGRVNTLCRSVIGLIMRRQKFGEPQTVKVYPSFLNLEKYELAAISKNLRMGGQKRMRRIGQSQEFDHIKDYVIGDDPRHINWKATARRSGLMLNHYVDEKSQPVYCMIDKGRPMKMPFEGMTLLDYSINAALVLSNIALKRGDRAGLVTFQHKPETFVPAQKRNLQVSYLLESLYKQKTSFNETGFSSLYPFVSQRITQRSLLLLFTNFESIYSLERQLPYLKLLNKHHLLLVIFFKNSEVENLLDAPAKRAREVYDKAIAKQLFDEKRAIRNMLHQHGILTLYTRPQNLKVDVINKYIEIKTKRLL
jgi:uncharacterized protein (DUF58 family)